MARERVLIGDILALQDEVFAPASSALYSYPFSLYKVLRSGHLALAERAMRAMEKKGTGLNNLHVEVPFSGSHRPLSLSSQPSTPTANHTVSDLQSCVGQPHQQTPTPITGNPNPEWHPDMRTRQFLSVTCNQVLGAGCELQNVRAVSVSKKSDKISGERFCPVHCAAINPNPTFLKQLLRVAPDALHCLDSTEVRFRDDGRRASMLDKRQRQARWTERVSVVVRCCRQRICACVVQCCAVSRAGVGRGADALLGEWVWAAMWVGRCG